MSEILFDSIPLSDALARAVADMNYTTATKIQADAIPLIMAGRDVIGRSSTGTGKTAAFGIPAVELVEGGDKSAQVLVLSPTRELAMQIAVEMRKFAKYKPGVSVVCVYGGAEMEPQIRGLRTANIVIGTPGRVLDHLRRRTLKLENLKMAVLDEADEMLNMGFYEDIHSILSQSPVSRQTVLFSATMPPAILKITGEFLKDPETVDIRTGQRTIAAVEQYFYQVPQGSKMDAVNLLLQCEAPRRGVVFCNTKSMVDDLTSYLGERGFRAMGLHGDMKQSARSQVMQSFRDGKTKVLVATDVAARGIDVEDIETVINFDIPQEFEYYIHRIGRTGRAGKAGSSHTLVCNYKQLATIRALQQFINAPIKESHLPTEKTIMEKRMEKFSAKVKKALAAEDLSAMGAHLDGICEETGRDIRDVACALALIVRGREQKAVPVISAAGKGRPPLKGGRRAVLRADIGRSSRVAPGLLAGAIAKAAGLPSRAVGAIDIHDEYTLIEMHENDALEALDRLNNVSVGGRAVRFCLSGEQLRPAPPRRTEGAKPVFRDKPRGRAARFDRTPKGRKGPRDFD